jgi:hypothetical protein
VERRTIAGLCSQHDRLFEQASPGLVRIIHCAVPVIPDRLP